MNQGCPDRKADVLTTTLMVLADRDNYIYLYMQENSIYGSYGGMSLPSTDL